MSANWHSRVSELREVAWRESMIAEAAGDRELAEALRWMSGTCTTACSGDRDALAVISYELERRATQLPHRYPTRT